MTIKKPNILIFMTDDQGPWAMNCAGTPELKTPTLDKLSEEGMRFNNFFCASPVCSPARASFLTGSIPSQHGVHDWIKHGCMNDPEGRTWHGPETSIEYLKGKIGFTDILAQNGYTCGISGKWHIGASDIPQKSHDFWCTHSLGGSSYVDYWVFDNSKEMTHQTKYISDYFSDKAIDYLISQKDNEQPFCLSVHYTAPHGPWIQEEQPADIWDSYNNTEFSLPVESAHPWKGWDPTPEKRKLIIQGYYTTITAMDRAVGRVLDTLEELGMKEDTIVIFTSDNGFNMGHHGIKGKGNGTFPLNMFEESVKVPFIIRFPKNISPGEVCEDLVSQYDFFPTLLDYLGIENKEKEKLPGQSFANALRGIKEKDNDKNIVIYDEYGPNRMIRTKEWKYIHRYPKGPNELYDLKNDPTEKVNLIDDINHSKTINQLKQDLNDWYNQYANSMCDGSKLTDCIGKGQLKKINNVQIKEAFSN